MVAIIDNYDSFTYNIYQMISQIIEIDPDEEVKVFRNDAITVPELEALNPGRLIISPGPGTPANAGISIDAIRAFALKIPILGVCLGHQCLAEAYGGNIIGAKHIIQGKVEPIEVDGCGVLRNLPNPCAFTRYHSLVVDPASVPAELEVTSRSVDGEIMGLRHRTLPIEGVQFHPESIGSNFGERLLINFLNWKRKPLERSILLNKVVSGEDLSKNEAADFMDELTDGSLEDAYIAGMLTSLSAKGITADEVAGCASVLVKKRRPVDLSKKLNSSSEEFRGILDTCGTGGDGLHTFNISSFAALLASSCGATVAKHGNRAVSSKSGSTDFYEALGIPTDLDADGVVASIASEGFAYMAAPLFHDAMKHAGPVRRALGIKTIMNTLGPLVNPAGADFQIIGVFDDDLLPVMARAAKMLGVKCVWTVRSLDGLDEISPGAPTKIFRIDENGVESEELFHPSSLGIPSCHVANLAGGSGTENARTAWKLLRGGGAATLREAVCLNTGAALSVAGITSSIAEGYQKAKAALDDGRGLAKVEALRKRAGGSSL